MSEQNIKESNIASDKPKSRGDLIFEQLSRKLHDLFKPEEVEVTFEGTGSNKTYKIVNDRKG